MVKTQDLGSLKVRLAGSGFSSPAAVHTRLVESPAGICPLGAEWELDRQTLTLFLGAHRKLGSNVQAEAQIRSQSQWDLFFLSSSCAFQPLMKHPPVVREQGIHLVHTG